MFRISAESERKNALRRMHENALIVALVRVQLAQRVAGLSFRARAAGRR